MIFSVSLSRGNIWRVINKSIITRMVITMPVITIPFLDVISGIISPRVANLICSPQSKENHEFTVTNSLIKEFILRIPHDQWIIRKRSQIKVIIYCSENIAIISLTELSQVFPLDVLVIWFTLSQKQMEVWWLLCGSGRWLLCDHWTTWEGKSHYCVQVHFKSAFRAGHHLQHNCGIDHLSLQ